MDSNKYFLYARKSTDDPKRQLRSIKDQIAEARDLASREGIVIVDTFIEKQTAKKPGRPIFNEMLERIERGEASGILAWHPDRLARNSLDGGRLIWLVDTGKIVGLKFPSFRFDITPQGKLSLAIEFGISKYYVDKLSEDIKRGIRQKVQNGIWPHVAPLGYLNHNATKTIVADPEKAPLIRKAYEMYATGNYTLRQVKTRFANLGLCGPKGGVLSVANFQYILKNPVYYGLIRFHDEYHNGKHEPIITKELFDCAQAVMSEKSKPKSDKLKPYLYRGLFHCGECGRLVTAETQKGHNYLRCSKWEVKCSQRYVREEAIAGQITDALRLVALPAEWADWMLAEAEVEQTTAAEVIESQTKAVKLEMAAFDDRLDRLMTAYVETVLSLPEYKIAKNKLMDEKHGLTEKLARIQKDQSSAFEPLKNFITASKEAGILADTGSDEQKRDFFKKVASNPNVFNRELRFEPRGAWQLVAGQGSFAQHNTASDISDAVFAGETRDVERKRRGGDSNPRDGLSRQQHFQCCSFSRSDTSPGLQFQQRGEHLNQVLRRFPRFGDGVIFSGGDGIGPSVFRAAHENRSHFERARRIRFFMSVFCHIGSHHHHCGLPDSVDVGGFIFNPVIFNAYAYLHGAAGGSFTFKPPLFWVNCRLPLEPSSVTD